MKKLKIKLGDIDFLIKCLSIHLPFERSKARVEFIKTLNPAFLVMEQKRMKLMDDTCKKDKDGKPIMDEKGQFTFDPGIYESLSKKWPKIQEEFYEVEINEHIEKNLFIIRDIIVKSDKDLSIQETVILERIINAIDAIQ